MHIFVGKHNLTTQSNLDELTKLLDGESDTTQKFLVSEEQVDRQGRVDMNQQGIFHVPGKRPDSRVLLDFPEEYLNLPAIFVNLGDSPGRKTEVIGQEFVTSAVSRSR